MMSDKIKFLEKDVEYWEIQNDLYPTLRTSDSLHMAKTRLEEYLIEEAALKSAMNHGSPDISGGIQIDDHLELVNFKDKDGRISMTMTLEAFEAFGKSMEENNDS